MEPSEGSFQEDVPLPPINGDDKREQDMDAPSIAKEIKSREPGETIMRMARIYLNACILIFAAVTAGHLADTIAHMRDRIAALATDLDATLDRNAKLEKDMEDLKAEVDKMKIEFQKLKK